MTSKCKDEQQYTEKKNHPSFFAFKKEKISLHFFFFTRRRRNFSVFAIYDRGADFKAASRLALSTGPSSTPRHLSVPPKSTSAFASFSFSFRNAWVVQGRGNNSIQREANKSKSAHLARFVRRQGYSRALVVVLPAAARSQVPGGMSLSGVIIHRRAGWRARGRQCH